VSDAGAAGPVVGVLGGRGRFGSRILAALREVGVAAHPHDADTAPPLSVIVDASSPSALDTLMAAVERDGCGVVSCVSGIPADGRERLRALAGRVPVLVVANASVGSHLQLALARLLAESPLLDGYDVACTVVDRHPVTKRDAPSATALRIADVVRPGRGAVTIRSDRHGGPVADHALVLDFGSESLRIEHSVRTLDNSARQVARLALLISGLPAGLYRVSDVYERFGGTLANT
jgi:4-hydroxy-tetrahydrodipicolinate reductase